MRNAINSRCGVTLVSVSGARLLAPAMPVTVRNKAALDIAAIARVILIINAHSIREMTVDGVGTRDGIERSMACALGR
jgi:hypothetical protein